MAIRGLLFIYTRHFGIENIATAEADFRFASNFPVKLDIEMVNWHVRMDRKKKGTKVREGEQEVKKITRTYIHILIMVRKPLPCCKKDFRKKKTQ